MASYVDGKLSKVLDLLFKNRRIIEKQKLKVNKLKQKMDIATNKLAKMQEKEEKLRDIYDFYYGEHYHGNTDGRTKVLNAYGMHCNTYAHKPKEERARVQLPEID